MEKLEFKGTKGDWVVGIDNNHLESYVTTKTHRIADVKHYGSKIHPTKLEPTLEEGRANAKLIAAAPFLLEALQELMRVYNEKGQLLSYNVGIARKAIEKALK